MKRIHRIGQEYAVKIYRLTSAGSVDAAIRRVHADKQALADAVVDKLWDRFAATQDAGEETTWRRAGRIVDSCMMLDENGQRFLREKKPAPPPPPPPPSTASTSSASARGAPGSSLAVPLRAHDPAARKRPLTGPEAMRQFVGASAPPPPMPAKPFRLGAIAVATPATKKRRKPAVPPPRLLPHGRVTVVDHSD